MHAAVPAQVDPLRARTRCRRTSASTSSRSLADEREHRAVVVGVRVDVEELRALASARPIALTTAASRPSEKFGTASSGSAIRRTLGPSGDRLRQGSPGAGIAAPRPAWAAELNARRDEVLATLRDEGVDRRVGLPRRRDARLLPEGRRRRRTPRTSTRARSTRSTRTTAGSRTRPSPSDASSSCWSTSRTSSGASTSRTHAQAVLAHVGGTSPSRMPR